MRRPSAWLREGGLCLNPSPPLLLHLALPQALPTQGEACSLGNRQPGGAGAACQGARSGLWLSLPTTSPCDLPCSGHIQRRWSRGKLSPLWGPQSSPVDLVRTFRPTSVICNPGLGSSSWLGPSGAEGPPLPPPLPYQFLQKPTGTSLSTLSCLASKSDHEEGNHISTPESRIPFTDV